MKRSPSGKRFNRVFLIPAFLLIVAAATAYGVYRHIEADRLPAEIRAMHEAFKNGKPAFSIDEAKAYAAELIPLVEKATERRFKTLPNIRLVDENGIKSVLARTLIPQMENSKKNWAKGRILKEAEAKAEFMSRDSLGMYGFQDKALYLMPKRIYPLLKLLNLEKRHSEAIIKLHIAHELAHALQDQYIDLGKKICSIHSPDAMEALLSTIEGHAVFVQERVGNALNLDHDVMQAFLKKATGEIMFKDPILQMSYKINMFNQGMRYLGGKQFIEYHYSHGGNERVWQILSSPPQDTAMIMNPATYSPENEPTIDLAYLLEGLDTYFGTGEKIVENFDPPKTNLAFLALLSINKRREVLLNINKIQMLSVSLDNDSIGEVLICLLNDESYGLKLLQCFEDFEVKIDQYLKDNLSNYSDHLVFANHSALRSDYAREQKKLNAAGKELNIKIRFLHKRLLVEISSFANKNSVISQEAFENIYSEIIRRYDST